MNDSGIDINSPASTSLQLITSESLPSFDGKFTGLNAVHNFTIFHNKDWIG